MSETDKMTFKFEAWVGLRVVVTPQLREGEVWATGRSVLANRLTAWRLVHPRAQPMLSRFARGVLELQRDRRRHG